ncbi:MAG: metal-dependent hydrolase [Sphingobacteriales bacterium]|nr:MAG: metal-dependent hydrolase [Sphingobacteriales bacterium]
MKFTFYGHSCFAIEVAGKKLLFDPFITGNELAKDIDVNTIEADYILVSHGHSDHVGDLVSIAKRTGATVIGAYEVVAWAQKQGCEKGHGMNFGPFNFEFGELRYVVAHHSSGLPDGSYGGNPGGFVLKTAEGNFYFAGDTCLTLDMQLIPKYFAKLDFALLPIGGNFTMNVDDAVIASQFIECKKIVGVHFDTFGYIKIDHQQAKDKFKAAGAELILPEIGQTIEL